MLSEKGFEMQAILLTADYANVTGDRKLNVMGVFNQISSRQFPMRHATMYIVVAIVAELGETTDPRQFVLRILDQEAEEIGRGEGVFNFPEAPTGGVPEINIIIPIIGQVFPKPGEHDVVLLVDGQHVADRRILVNLVEHPEE